MLLFPVVAMVSFDLITMKAGIWTVGTALVYGLIGLAFYSYFKGKEKAGLKSYAKASILGVLFFDFVTGPIMSSFIFEIPFQTALIGQIPFTVLHITSALIYTLILAPVLNPHIANSVTANLDKQISRVKMLIKIPERVF